MDLQSKARAKKEAAKVQQTEAFRDFMEEPMTRLALSGLGDITKHDTFNLLLFAAFEAGFGCGQANVLIDIGGALFKSKSANPDS